MSDGPVIGYALASREKDALYSEQWSVGNVDPRYDVQDLQFELRRQVALGQMPHDILDEYDLKLVELRVVEDFTY